MKLKIAILVLVSLLLVGCADKSGAVIYRDLMLEFESYSCDQMGLTILKDITAYKLDEPEITYYLEEFFYPAPCVDFEVYLSYRSRK